MKAVWKKRWLKALRSGEYEQAVHRLRAVTVGPVKKVEGFCCLGVLCDIAGVRWQNNECKFGAKKLNDRGLDFFDISSGAQNILCELNDESRRSFKQIAQHIEKHL